MYSLKKTMVRSRKVAIFAAFVSSILLFASCGEMDSMFPINRTYQVSALAEGVPIDECFLIGQNDRVRPFFIQSVKGDTDLSGLRVLIQYADGEPAGDQFLYYLSATDDPPYENPFFDDPFDKGPHFYEDSYDADSHTDFHDEGDDLSGPDADEFHN